MDKINILFYFLLLSACNLGSYNFYGLNGHFGQKI